MCIPIRLFIMRATWFCQYAHACKLAYIIYACPYLLAARYSSSSEVHKTTERVVPMATSDSDIHLFSTWFQTLDSGERRWFLDKLVSVAAPHKLFAQVERALACPQRLPAAWGECRTFEDQALFCVARVSSWSAAEANRYMNVLEEIDQAAVYEFYDKIASTVKEP